MPNYPNSVIGRRQAAADVAKVLNKQTKSKPKAKTVKQPK